MVGIYRNGMETSAKREQMIKLPGRNCTRGSAEQALRDHARQAHQSVLLPDPVLGRNLEVAASERLLSATPKGLQRKVFLGLVLRTGGGAGYQLVVYPAQQKVQLRKNLPGGKVKYLGIARGQRRCRGSTEQTNSACRRSISPAGPNGAVPPLRIRRRQAGRRSGRSGARELSGSASGVAVGSASMRPRRDRQRRQRRSPGAQPVLSAPRRGPGRLPPSAYLAPNAQSWARSSPPGSDCELFGGGARVGVQRDFEATCTWWLLHFELAGRPGTLAIASEITATAARARLFPAPSH